MNIDLEQTCTVFDELSPGDHIVVEQGLILDAEDEFAETVGTVLRTEHACHPHKSGSQVGNLILMELHNGELVVLKIGESTVVRRA